MSTNSNNNILVENEKNNLSESFDKYYEDHMKENVFFFWMEGKIHHIGKNLVMKTNIKKMIMWKKKKKKKKNHFDKRRKKTKVSSPNNRYEYPDTTYYDILHENRIYTTIINFVTDQFTRGNIFETLVGKSLFEKYGDLIKKMEEKEEERINKLVLKYILQKYVNGDEDTWIVKMENEIKGVYLNGNVHAIF
ncbi:DnaJ protein,putative, putative [Plasmodium sp. DRC-Itaito]|nr:DnaJ protein,putative, putative [Plasmodium sp. DRC-Itaito]